MHLPPVVEEQQLRRSDALERMSCSRNKNKLLSLNQRRKSSFVIFWSWKHLNLPDICFSVKAFCDTFQLWLTIKFGVAHKRPQLWICLKMCPDSRSYGKWESFLKIVVSFAAAGFHCVAPEAAHKNPLPLLFLSIHTATRLPYEASHFSYVTSFVGGVLAASIHMHGCFTPLNAVGDSPPGSLPTSNG